MSRAQTEPDLQTVRAALAILFHGVPEEQQALLWDFLLAEMERLYIADSRSPPAWLGRLRQEIRDSTIMEAKSGTTDSHHVTRATE